MGLTSAIRREAIYLGSIARTLWLLRRVKPGATRSIVDIVEAQAKNRPGNTAILYQGRAMSYAQLDARANRYAHWAMGCGIGRGTPVALVMENRPDFICAWLGMFKVGAQVALINTNLVGAALSHSINVSGAHHAIDLLGVRFQLRIIEVRIRRRRRIGSAARARFGQQDHCRRGQNRHDQRPYPHRRRPSARTAATRRTRFRDVGGRSTLVTNDRLRRDLGATLPALHASISPFAILTAASIAA